MNLIFAEAPQVFQWSFQFIAAFFRLDAAPCEIAELTLPAHTNLLCQANRVLVGRNMNAKRRIGLERHRRAARDDVIHVLAQSTRASRIAENDQLERTVLLGRQLQSLLAKARLEIE
jgi:hypothetical protein